MGQIPWIWTKGLYISFMFCSNVKCSCITQPFLSVYFSHTHTHTHTQMNTQTFPTKNPSPPKNGGTPWGRYYQDQGSGPVFYPSYPCCYSPSLHRNTSPNWLTPSFSKCIRDVIQVEQKSYTCCKKWYTSILLGPRWVWSGWLTHNIHTNFL